MREGNVEILAFRSRSEAGGCSPAFCVLRLLCGVPWTMPPENSGIVDDLNPGQRPQ